jgi:hypothetical protein
MAGPYFLREQNIFLTQKINQMERDSFDKLYNVF